MRPLCPVRDLFYDQNFRSERGFFLMCRNVQVFYYLLFLKAFAYFNGSKNGKTTTFLKKYIIMWHFHCPIKKCMLSAAGLRNDSENFGLEILNSLNSARSMLEECFPPNFISMKFNELSAEKRWEEIIFTTSVTVHPLFNLLFCRWILFLCSICGKVLFSCIASMQACIAEACSQ